MLRPSPYLLQVTSQTLFFPVWSYSPHTFRSERIPESHNLTLVQATWPGSNLFSPSSASHNAFREILKSALADLCTNHPETPCNYGWVIQKRSQASGDEGRYLYKIFQADVSNQCLPQPATMKLLAKWIDSIDM